MATFNGIGMRLEKLRDQAGWSQKQVSDTLGFSDNAYGMYEREERRPDYETLIRLSDLFDVSTDYLLKGQDFTAKNAHVRQLLQFLNQFWKHDIQNPFILDAGQMAQLSRDDLQTLQRMADALKFQANHQQDGDP